MHIQSDRSSLVLHVLAVSLVLSGGLLHEAVQAVTPAGALTPGPGGNRGARPGAAQGYRGGRGPSGGLY